MEENNIQVNVIDSVCGSYKTTAAINMINNSSEEVRYLYITPFLSEVKRIKEQCSSKHFCEPKVQKTKLNAIKDLLKNKRNIVSTHALFHKFDQESIELSYLNNYVLVLDEVSEVVQPMNVTKDDLDTILTKYAYVNENNVLIWTATEYEGRFEDYKQLSELGCIAVYNNMAFLWLFPISIFKAFKSIYILTYMFEAQTQCYYYKYYGIKYKYLYVKDNSYFTEEKQEIDINEYKKLINIYDNEKANDIGKFDYTLSATWYLKKSEDMYFFNELKKKTVTYFMNMNTLSKDNMWTCYKNYKQYISGNGYTKGFVSLNARATNDYRHKISLAYLSNIYLNPFIKNFFIQHNININEDMFALSELLQWMFRSQLREKKPINIFIPSKRMRELLKNWE